MVGDMTSRELQGQFVTLAPRIEVALSERGGRVLDDWEMRRIPEMYRAGLHRPGFGLVFYNSDEVPEETANRILAGLSL